MKDIYVFLHACTLKSYKEIFKEMWEKSLPMVKDSKKTYIGVVGPNRLEPQEFPNNIEVVYFNEDPTTKQLPNEEDFMRRSIDGDHSCHEFSTLDLIRKTCKENDCVVGYYHLDHIYPIAKGFENGIPPSIIGDISNLRFIPWEENIEKSDKLL